MTPRLTAPTPLTWSPPPRTRRISAGFALLAGAGLAVFGSRAAHGAEPTRARAPATTLGDVLREAVERSPAIRGARAGRDAGLGGARAAEGAFDWTLRASAARGQSHTHAGGVSFTREGSTALDLGISKKFGFGLVVEPRISLRAANIEDISGNGTSDASSTAGIGLAITQPVLRGLGDATRAEADAAQRFAEAAARELEHAVSERVSIVASAYWEYVRAAEALGIHQRAEQRAARLLADVQALVAGEERPKSDLERVHANVADRTRARIEAEQDVRDARRALALLVGRAPDDAPISPPATTLPEPGPAPSAELLRELVVGALARRHDLAAAKLRAEAASLLVDGAADAARPRLDVVGRIGWSGAVRGAGVGDLFTPISENIPGIDARISLEFELPLTNDAANGVADERVALLRQAEVEAEDVARRVVAGVEAAAERLDTDARALGWTEEAAARYHAAVDNERTKLASGLSTVIDVVSMEEETTRAALEALERRALVARGLAALAHEAGRLTEPDAAGPRIVLDALLATPAR